MSADGTWDQVLARLLAAADAGGAIDWATSVDSTIARAHQHATNLTRHTGAGSNYTNLLTEPPDHAVGRSRGGLSTKGRRRRTSPGRAGRPRPGQRRPDL
jgi:hypothetical protein